MSFTLPVIWSRDGATQSGRLDVAGERLTLTSRQQTFAFCADSVVGFMIERGPADRLRGLPVLCVRLTGGEVVRIASMGGAGSLHALAAVVGGNQAAVSGT